MNPNDLITIQDLRRRYGPARGCGFEAVRGVSFSVRRGELFALLGTNGAGKTSTLEVIEGIALPTAGTVRVLSYDPYRDRRLVRPRIGIMLQDAGFPADPTVTQTGRLWAGTLTSPRPVEEALELVGLRQRARVSVKQLSGGESAGWTWPWLFSDTPRSSSSTNRPPAWTGEPRPYLAACELAAGLRGDSGADHPLPG